MASRSVISSLLYRVYVLLCFEVKTSDSLGRCLEKNCAEEKFAERERERGGGEGLLCADN